jgi:hypothetical protein
MPISSIRDQCHLNCENREIDILPPNSYLWDKTTAFGRATLAGSAVPVGRFLSCQKGQGEDQQVPLGAPASRRHSFHCILPARRRRSQDGYSSGIRTWNRPDLRGRPKPRISGVVDCSYSRIRKKTAKTSKTAKILEIAGIFSAWAAFGRRLYHEGSFFAVFAVFAVFAWTCVAEAL